MTIGRIRARATALRGRAGGADEELALARAWAALESGEPDPVNFPGLVSAYQNAQIAFLATLTQGALAGGPCKTAATTNITLSGVQNIAGVTGAADQRVLLTAQSTASQNGPWLQKAGSWVRPTDFDASAEAVQGAFVLVTDGDNRGGYLLTTPDPITLGTTALNWVRVSGYQGGNVNFGSGGVFDIPTVNASGNWNRTMFIQPAPATGTQTNSAGGNDAVSVSLVIASGRVTNGPTGHANYWDTVMNFGLNQGPAFTPLNTDMPSASYRIESKFAQGGTTSPFIVEFHSSMFPASDPNNEYRLFSGTVPHLVADWDGPGADYTMRANLFRFMSGVGDDRIAMFFGGMGNLVEFKDGGVGKPHPTLLFMTNNRPTSHQRNAANTDILPAPYRNAQDNTHIAGGAIYLVTPTQATPVGTTGALVINITSGSAGQSGLSVSCPVITGDFFGSSINGSVSGNLISRLYNSGGSSLLDLAVLNGSSADALLGFTNDGGGGSFTIGYDNTTDTLRCEGSYKSVGNSNNLYWECDPTAGVTYFAKPPKLPSYTLAGLPSAATVGARSMAWCSNLSGGAGPVISDGTNWKVIPLGATAS